MIPDTVNKIAKNAFKNCSTITAITIPTSVTEICECAFHSCTHLENDVIIPSNITHIDWNTFFHYIKLSITTYSKESPLNVESFRWNVKLTVKAPAGSCAIQFAKENNFPFVEI